MTDHLALPESFHPKATHLYRVNHTTPSALAELYVVDEHAYHQLQRQAIYTLEEDTKDAIIPPGLFSEMVLIRMLAMYQRG